MCDISFYLPNLLAKHGFYGEPNWNKYYLLKSIILQFQDLLHSFTVTFSRINLFSRSVNSALRCCKMIFALKYIFLSNVMSQLLPCKCHILLLSEQLVSTSTEMTLVTVRCVTQWCWHSEHQDWTEQLWPPVLTRAARSWAELPCRAFQRDTRRTEPGALTVAAAHHSFPHSLIILLQLRRSATATSGHLPPNIMQWPGDCCKTGITTLLMTTANNGHNIQSAAFLHK